MFLRVTQKVKETWKAKTILNKLGGLRLSYFKTCYNATIMKTTALVQGQINGTMEPSGKSTTAIHGEMNCFSINGSAVIENLWKIKRSLTLYFMHYAKIKLRRIKGKCEQ